jgi:hypothetical protein
MAADERKRANLAKKRCCVKAFLNGVLFETCLVADESC